MKITLFNASVVCALCAMSGYASAAPSLRMTGGTPATATAPAGVGVSRGGSLRIGGMTGARSAVGTTAKTVSVSNGSKNMTASSSQRMPSVTSFIGTTKLGHNLNNGGTSVPAGDILSRMDALERDIDDLARQLDSSSAREIEMGMDDGYISWRHVGDTTWQHLIQIPDGDDTTGGMGGFYRLALADVEWAKENCMRAYDTSTYVGLFSLQDLDNVTETQYANALDGFLRTVEWMPCSGAESSTAANNLIQQLRTDTSFYDQVNHLAQLRAVVTNYTEPPVEPTVYTIAYNLNGGNWGGASGASQYTAGIEYTIPTSVTRTGYTFAGWCTDSGLTNCAASQTISATATGNKTFYAKWTANTYSITCDYNGGLGTACPSTYTYGTSTTINVAPTKLGYVFAGWCTDSGLTDCATTQTISATATGNKTFYAKWTESPKYTITYHKDGGNWGSGTHPNVYTEGVGMEVSATLVKAGYRFVGWCDNSALTQNCAVPRTISTSATGNKDFYAKFNQTELPTKTSVSADDLYVLEESATDLRDLVSAVASRYPAGVKCYPEEVTGSPVNLNIVSEVDALGTAIETVGGVRNNYTPDTAVSAYNTLVEKMSAVIIKYYNWIVNISSDDALANIYSPNYYNTCKPYIENNYQEYL